MSLAHEANRCSRIDNLIVKQMSQSEISMYWDAVSASIRSVMPDSAIDDPAVDMNLLAAARDGRLQCWAMLTRKDDTVHLVGIITTRITTESLLKLRSLTIYSMYMPEGVESECWEKAAKVIEKYAREQSCTSIKAMTSNPHVVRIAESVGFNSRWRVLNKELG